MSSTNWHLIKRQRGIRREPVSLKLDPAVSKALRELAKKETKILGIKISKETIIHTYLLRHNSWIRKRVKEIGKEKPSEKKYMDIIPPGATPDEFDY